MKVSEQLRRNENLHIVFWLIKDSCWMLELRWPGSLMVLPALVMAVRICILTRHSRELLINMAILCWITANSYWMLVEFFASGAHKNMAGIPFALGFIFVGLYYSKGFKKPDIG